MLSGGTLCGIRSSSTKIIFRGDAGALLWDGVSDADIHDINLDSSCLTNTIEQTHLVHLSTGHVIRDVELEHPKRATIAGDAINIVGSQTNPMTGMMIDNVIFDSCARMGVQISRGVSGGKITNSKFGDRCTIGSEGSGAIDGLVISHDTFTSTTGNGLALDIQRQTNLLVSHVTSQGHGMFFFICDNCTVEHSSIDGLVPTLSGDFIPALTVNDNAHNFRISDVSISQGTTSPAPAIRIGPLRSNRQADIANVEIDNVSITQHTTAPVVQAFGVSGLKLTNSNLTYDGPGIYVSSELLSGPSIATAPATSVPMTDVVVENNFLSGVNP